MPPQNSLSLRFFDEIGALNQRFIDVLETASETRAIDVSEEIARGLATTDANPQSRFGRLPFLIYRLYDAEKHHGGPAGIPHSVAGARELVTLTASFIWQLAQEDVTLATLVTGFDQGWCQDFADQSIADLAGFATRASLRTRLIDAPGYWQDLVRQRGISAIQRASLGAAGLQLILSRARRSRVRQSLPRPVLPAASRRQR